MNGTRPPIYHDRCTHCREAQLTSSFDVCTTCHEKWKRTPKDQNNQCLCPSCFTNKTTPNRTLCPTCRKMWESAQNFPSPSSQQGGLVSGFVPPSPSPQQGGFGGGFLGGGFGTGGAPMQQQPTFDFTKPPPLQHQMPSQQSPPPGSPMPSQQQQQQQTTFNFNMPPPLGPQMPSQQQQQTTFDLNKPPPLATQMPPKQQQKEVTVDEVKRKMKAKCSFCYSNGGDAIFVVGSLAHESYLPLLVNFVVPRTPRGMEAFFMFQKAFVQTKSIVTLKEETNQIELVDKVRLYTTEQWHNNGHTISDKVAEDLINSMR